MAGQLDSLNARDLHAYMTKISWPKKIYREPIPMSESYSNPHLQPNPCVGDSDFVVEYKKDQKIKTMFMQYYLEIAGHKKEIIHSNDIMR